MVNRLCSALQEEGPKLGKRRNFLRQHGDAKGATKRPSHRYFDEEGKKNMLVLSKFLTASRSPWKVKTDSTHALEPPEELKIRPVLRQTISFAEAKVVISRSNTALTDSSRDGIKKSPTYLPLP